MTQTASQLDRVVRLMREAVSRCRLDLRGKVVLTEAATGPYAVTPVLAALAGAERVYALACTTAAHGTATEAVTQTRSLAGRADLDGGRIDIVTAKTRDVVADADVVTNSGHVRPIDRETVEWMKPTAVVTLMYEPWELRPQDVDVETCRVRGIRVAGTNERHPNVGVFSYLGVMAIKLLTDAGVAVHGSRIILLCDNPFAPVLQRTLTSVGAKVELVSTTLGDATTERADAVLVAAKPRAEAVVKEHDAELIARRWLGAAVVQFWGDVERAAAAASGVPVWPPTAPPRGHMGILPSALGPEPVVRLQSGGLKVAEVLLCNSGAADPEWDYLREIP